MEQTWYHARMNVLKKKFFGFVLIGIIALAAFFIQQQINRFHQKNQEHIPLSNITVVDGDTIKAQVNGAKETIRIIGIDTP